VWAAERTWGLHWCVLDQLLITSASSASACALLVPAATHPSVAATPSPATTAARQRSSAQTSHCHAGYIARMSRHDRAGAVVLPVASRSALLHRPARETHAPCATPGLVKAVVVSGRRCTHAAVRGPSRSTRASTRRHNIWHTADCSPRLSKYQQPRYVSKSTARTRHTRGT
jgi:hypothetical protein